LLLERMPALIGGGNEQAGSALGGHASSVKGLPGVPEADFVPEIASTPEIATPPETAARPETDAAPETAARPATVDVPETEQASALPGIVSLDQAPKSEPVTAPTEASVTVSASTGLLLEPTSVREDTSSAPADPISAPDADSFEGALERHRRRMEKLNFRESFVRELLVVDARLELGDIALRWAGMPNKNERAITQEVLEALAQAGFLERSDDQTYRVVRTP
jgi:hypothetical protein